MAKNSNISIDSIKHSDKRANIPTKELSDFVEDDEKKPKTLLYPRDPSLDPQLVWKGKDEQDSSDLEVQAVPIYIQEKIKPQVIIEEVRSNTKKEPSEQPDLFADFNGLEFEDVIDFYRHEQNWTNRMILGDSLLVMTSLAEKEGLKGQVQMIYIDPPYGIKFGSNWQVSTRKRDVKDGSADDLTRQPEQIKAFRDTWELGIHSYLTYLRDRLTVARDLLTESGSIFVQIGDENVHLVRCLIDEVFGSDNFVSEIIYTKTSGQTTSYIATINDYILFYAKDRERLKYRQLFRDKFDGSGISAYQFVETENGEYRKVSDDDNIEIFSDKLFRISDINSQGESTSSHEFNFQGEQFSPRKGCHWSVTVDGLENLQKSKRITKSGNTIGFKRYLKDYPVFELNNIWADAGSSLGTDKMYVVQTGLKVAQRCLLMTTDPGDLVLDPTCVRKGTLVLCPPLSPRERGEISPFFPCECGDINHSNSMDGKSENLSPTLSVNRERAKNLPSSAVGQKAPLPTLTGGLRGEKSIPIESIKPDDMVYGHDCSPHKVLRVIQKKYKGLMIGISHAQSEDTLWLTADHRVLAKLRPRTLGGKRDWSAIPGKHFERARELRKESSPPEQKLWAVLRGRQMSLTPTLSVNGEGDNSSVYSKPQEHTSPACGGTQGGISPRSRGDKGGQIKFRRQHPIGPYIADFYSRDAHLVVEVDGSTHFTEESIAYDKERDAYMRSLGLDVLRFTTTEVMYNIEGVYLAIQNQCNIRMQSVEGAQWVQAGSLEKGDLIFYGLEKEAVTIESIEVVHTDEEVYDLEIENSHSFLTNVCAVHNCGSGTTAYVAEQWGRRWITIDTSRVAIALARTRLMSAKYPYYLLADSPEGIRKETDVAGIIPSANMPKTNNDIKKGFVYKRVPHITLKAIANNPEIDVIYNKWQEKLEPIRAKLNQILNQSYEEWQIPRELTTLTPITPYGPPCKGDGGANGSTYKGDDDAKWSEETKRLHKEWWELRRQRQKEIDDSISRNADMETLYDQPYEDNKRIRVTGPFTVESLSPHRVISTDEERPASESEAQEQRTVGQFEMMVIDNLRKAGVQNTRKNERLKFERLDTYAGAYIHAEGEYIENDQTKRVAVCIGPEHGTVDADLVKESAKEAVRGLGFDLLIVCGFAFDPHVSEEVKQYGKLPVLQTRMNPDLLMGDELLKKTGAGNLFMVFGEPDIDVDKQSDGKIVVTIKGVDIYDPTTGQIRSSSTDDIACWFIDTNYNDESFFVRHAYFCSADKPYESLQRALRAEINESAWTNLYSTVSYPFSSPDTGKIAIKVINHYGDEVLKIYAI
jgi:very-short-patch-repair endonuclease/DNA modification methylase